MALDQKLKLLLCCFGGWATLGLAFGLISFASIATAADLKINSNQTTYRVGDTVAIRLAVESPNEAINAVSGQVSFPADKLEVLSLSKAGSIITLWVKEPSYQNQAGRIDFEGAILNPGFTGSTGQLLTVNFKIKQAGTIPLRFAAGSIFANDGQGTSVLDELGQLVLTAVALPPSTKPIVSAPVVEAEPTESLIANLPFVPTVVADNWGPWLAVVVVLAVIFPFLFIIVLLMFVIIIWRRLDSVEMLARSQNAAGPQGLPGMPGPRGEPGPAGPKGDRGEPGLNGKDGRDGLNGKDGAPGLPGPKGDKGEQGEPGPQGPKGERGEMGLPGPQGPQGLTGAVGPQGLTGPKGDQGDLGPQGEPGIPGVAAAKGEPGPKGEKGDKGDPGLNGKDGRDGLDGKDGRDGKDGKDGAPGPRGPKGDKGDPGEPGPAGDSRSQGR